MKKKKTTESLNHYLSQVSLTCKITVYVLMRNNSTAMWKYSYSKKLAQLINSYNGITDSEFMSRYWKQDMNLDMSNLFANWKSDHKEGGSNNASKASHVLGRLHLYYRARKHGVRHKTFVWGPLSLLSQLSLRRGGVNWAVLCSLFGFRK